MLASCGGPTVKVSHPRSESESGLAGHAVETVTSVPRVDPRVLRAIRQRVGDDLDRAKQLLHRAFSEDHTSEEVAQSFSLGVFITMLPTLGVGFLVFVLLAAVFDRLSKLALIASAVVFNPVVKWGVYALSLGLGTLLLGPVEGASVSDPSLAAAPPVVARLVLGNTILAVVAAVPSYFVSLWVVERFGDTAGDLIGDVTERILSPMPRLGSTDSPDEVVAGDADD